MFFRLNLVNLFWQRKRCKIEKKVPLWGLVTAILWVGVGCRNCQRVCLRLAIFCFSACERVCLRVSNSVFEVVKECVWHRKRVYLSRKNSINFYSENCIFRHHTDWQPLRATACRILAYLPQEIRATASDGILATVCRRRYVKNSQQEVRPAVRFPLPVCLRRASGGRSSCPSQTIRHIFRHR